MASRSASAHRSHRPPLVLDGPLGTELEARGVDTRGRAWSARAVVEAPDTIREIHAAYAASGADIHTANTFRTRPRDVGDAWRDLATQAVSLARHAVGTALVAGSVAPLEDCYRPDLTPADPRPEHRALARHLADVGVDLILCETFPTAREGWIAVEEAVATGLPTWAAFTAGPRADLMSPEALVDAARGAHDRGAERVFVNCVAVRRIGPYVAALARTGLPFGVYANAGDRADGLGWDANDPKAADTYARNADTWIEAGAGVIGGCCGTRPAHIAALRRLVDDRSTG